MSTTIVNDLTGTDHIRGDLAAQLLAAEIGATRGVNVEIVPQVIPLGTCPAYCEECAEGHTFIDPVNYNVELPGELDSFQVHRRCALAIVARATDELDINEYVSVEIGLPAIGQPATLAVAA